MPGHLCPARSHPVHARPSQKSSFSPDNGNCVEVAVPPEEGIGVRDSKEDRRSPPLLVSSGNV